jgi:hypothetical protein
MKTICLGLLLPQLVLAQVLSGEVLERGRGRPLSDVSVVVLPDRSTAVTDSQGRFEIPLSAESRELVIQHPGYKRFVRDLSSITTAAKIYLERDELAELGTTVVGQRARSTQGRKSIDRERFLTVPGAGGDPVKAVQNLPGVNRSPGFSSQVVIQGSGPQDTAYQIDGHEVPIVFHFGGLSSVVFPEAIDRVDTLSAGYGVESSRALGGIVQLWTRAPTDEPFRGLAFVDLGNSGLLLESSVNESNRVLIGFRQSYIGSVLKALFSDNEDFNLTVAPSYRDLNFRLDSKLNSKNEFRLTGVWSQDLAKFLLEKPVDADPSLRGSFENETRFWRVIPQWQFQANANRRFEASVGLGQDQISADIGNNFFELDNSAMTPKAAWEERWSPNFRTELGWDHAYSWTRFDIQLPSTLQEGGISNPLSSGEVLRSKGYAESLALGFYLAADYTWQDWTLSPNLRYDSFRETGSQHLSPRPQIRWNWDEFSFLKVAVGAYVQAPLPQESDATFGNPSLNAIHSQHFVLGASQDLRRGALSGWRWSSDLFYKNTRDRVVESTRLKADLSPERFTNEGRAESYGVQGELRYSTSRFSTSAILTLSEVEEWTQNSSRHPGEFDQTWLVGLLASWKLGSRWTIATRVRYATGNPYTPVVSAWFDSDSDTFVPVRGGLYSKRLPDFFQWDLRVDRRWVFEEWILSFYLDLQNLTNRKNAEGVQYSYDYKQNDFSSGLPVFPILGVKGEF